VLGLFSNTVVDSPRFLHLVRRSTREARLVDCSCVGNNCDDSLGRASEFVEGISVDVPLLELSGQLSFAIIS
jgi:hypothetical protein